MNTLADSIKSQIPHVLYKAESFFDATLFISMKIASQEQNNPDGSMDLGSHSSFAIGNITTLGFPSLPPSFLPLPRTFPLRAFENPLWKLNHVVSFFGHT